MRTVYLLVTIDTEEDNWGLSKDKVNLENITLIPKVQEIFDRYNIRPVYLCNTPVVEDDNASAIIKHLFDKGRCEIGMHLHPWNTPPIEEDICEYNTNLKNLPGKLVEKKIQYLKDIIYTKFGTLPIMFRSGRWGAGRDLFKILINSGFKIDSSITPFVSWKKYGDGSDYSSYWPIPFFWTMNNSSRSSCQMDGEILEIPVSIGFNRLHFEICASIRNLLRKALLKNLRLLGFMDYIGIMKDIWLSPEFNNWRDMLLLSENLVKQGINILNFTFHSPSLVPGLTPFVSDSKVFLNNIEKYFQSLKSEFNVVPVTSEEVVELALQGRIKFDHPKVLQE